MINPKIKNVKVELLSDNWYILNKVTYDYQKKDDSWETQIRESYDRGNGATILLYDKIKRTIILTRQFRLPSYLNGNVSGMMIETCAGLLDQEQPEQCIIRETEEETGYLLPRVQKIFEAYMSPGSVTEIVHFFIGEYDDSMKVSMGGGIKKEQEYIQVLELTFEYAYEMIATGEINDAKTIMLLQYAKINNLV